MTEKPIVFISCGQITAEEKELGREVCRLVGQYTSFEPYFAENQTSLDGLTKNILGALDRCVGLVVIMHPRGTVTFSDGQNHTRGSIWIEQEIAIAAFLTQVLGRDVQVAAYVHYDIHREGMRDKLQLNPTPFKNNAEVLEHLRQLLPEWERTPGISVSPLRLSLSHRVIKETGERHDYLLAVTVTNSGVAPVEDFHVDVSFPKAFLEGGHAQEVSSNRTETHRFFRIPMERQKIVVYPGDSKMLMSIRYFVDTRIYHDEKNLLDQKVTATLYFGGKAPQVVEKTMRELQHF